MRVSELLAQGRPLVSFEFFPPKNREGYRQLYATLATLHPFNPSFVSVTYGAGGSTRELTLKLVSKIKNELELEAVAHLTCVGSGQSEIKQILDRLEASHIENVLALRGDPPRDQANFTPHPDGFAHADELVKFIQDNYDFCLGVAGYPEGHPEAPDKLADLRFLKQKVDRGADFIITQLFFDNADYFDFVARARDLGITRSIIPGIMPITNLAQIERFTRMCGATLPADLLGVLRSCDGSPEAVTWVGIQHAVAQCRELLEGNAPGLHFYTLNKSTATPQIVEQLQKEGLL